MSELSSRFRHAIQEIDDTPARWRVFGVVVFHVAIYITLFGLPVPLFPDPVLGAIMSPGDRAITFVMGLPVTFPLGIYAGHVIHTLCEVDRND